MQTGSSRYLGSVLISWLFGHTFFVTRKKVLGSAISALRPPEFRGLLLLPQLVLVSFLNVLPPFADMFKPSNPMLARLRLTTKQVNGGYYKGNRTGSMGYFDKKGNYVIDWRKVRTYVVPDGLDEFKVS